MIAMIINRGTGEDNIRPGLAKKLSHAPAGFVVVEDCQVVKLGAKIVGADDFRRSRRLALADGCDLFGAVQARAAVARRHTYDGYVVAGGRQQRERTSGQDLRIVRMRMNAGNMHSFSL